MLTCQRQVPMKQEVGSTGRLLGPKDLLSHAESGDEKIYLHSKYQDFI